MKIRSQKTGYLLLVMILMALLVNGCSNGEIPEVYTLQVEVFEPGSGEVIVEPVRDYYPAGEEVTLTAVAAEGWAFDHWNDNLEEDVATITIVMDGNKQIIAHFLEEKPLGEPVEIDQGRVHFDGGVSLDLSKADLPEGTTVTAEEVTNPPLPQEASLETAGKVIDFSFSSTVADPVELKLPLKEGIDPEQAGIFYQKSDGSWEYQPSELVDGKLKATVTHFSTYGTLKGEKVSAPVSNITAGEVIAGTEVILSTATAGADIYYTLDGSKPGRDDNLFQNPIKIEEETTIKAVAVKDNMIDSEIATFNYTVADSSNKAGLNVAVNIPDYLNVGLTRAILLDGNGETLKEEEMVVVDREARATFVDLDAEANPEVVLKVEIYDEASNLLADGEKTITLNAGETLNVSVGIFNGSLSINIGIVDYPSPPTALEAVQNQGGVQLTWQPASGEIAGYLVFRSYQVDGFKTQLNQQLVSGNTYLDDSQLAPNTTYWYWVLAYNTEGYTSVLSEPVSIEVK